MSRNEAGMPDRVQPTAWLAGQACPLNSPIVPEVSPVLQLQDAQGKRGASRRVEGASWRVVGDLKRRGSTGALALDSTRCDRTVGEGSSRNFGVRGRWREEAATAQRARRVAVKVEWDDRRVNARMQVFFKLNTPFGPAKNRATNIQGLGIGKGRGPDSVAGVGSGRKNHLSALWRFGQVKNVRWGKGERCECGSIRLQELERLGVSRGSPRSWQRVLLDGVLTYEVGRGRPGGGRGLISHVQYQLQWDRPSSAGTKR